MDAVSPDPFVQPVPAQKEFVTFLTLLKFADIPQDVVAEARRLLLDQMACIVAARATEAEPVIRTGAAIFGDGPVAYAYELCRLGDVMDFDDGCVGAHFGCGAVAAALALAETTGATGQQIVAAIVAGFEAGARMSRAVGPYARTVDGELEFLPVWGITTPIVFAAVGAAANILCLAPDVAIEAFSLAAAATPVPTGGKWSEAVSLPNTKYCDSGWAALAGVSGALLAQSGSTGLTSIFDKNRGLFDMLGMPEATPDALCHGLGQEWLLRGILYKQWPCCGMLFPALTLVQEMAAEHGLAGKTIDAITVRLPATTRLPRFRNPDPATYVSLQFSVPHNLAMALKGVPAGPQWHLGDWADDAEMRALRHTITVLPFLPEHKAQGLAAHASITAHGETFERGAEPPSPGIRRPPSTDAGIADKVRAQIAEPQATQLLELVAGLETQSSAAELQLCLEQAIAP